MKCLFVDSNEECSLADANEIRYSLTWHGFPHLFGLMISIFLGLKFHSSAAHQMNPLDCIKLVISSGIAENFIESVRPQLPLVTVKYKL